MSDFPRIRTSIVELRAILESWAASSSLHQWENGADDSAISGVEDVLGRHLPEEMRALYRMSDGLWLLQGNLIIDRLRPDSSESFGLVNNSQYLREHGWQIPEELVMFGGNGSDDLFGLWVPKGPGDGPHPVITGGEIFDEEKAFAVMGTNLCRFLKAWTAYYTMLCLAEEDKEATKNALEALGVPKALWRFKEHELDDELMTNLFIWADPDLPDHNPDPYKRGVTANQLRLAYGSNR